MVIGVDDLIEGCITAAVSGAAEGIAKGLVEAVLTKLATKEDLSQAVSEIEGFIYNQILDLINDNLVVKSFVAQQMLADFHNNPRKAYLDAAIAPLDEAQAWLDVQLGQNGDVYRTRFVEILKFSVTSVAIWYNRALLDHGDRDNLKRRIAEVQNYLNNCIGQIRYMQRVSATPVQESSYQDPPDPDTHHPPTWYHAQFSAGCPATGMISHNYGPSRNSVGGQASADRAGILAQYNADEASRNQVLYAPIQQYIEAIGAMRLP